LSGSISHFSGPTRRWSPPLSMITSRRLAAISCSCAPTARCWSLERTATARAGGVARSATRWAKLSWRNKLGCFWENCAISGGLLPQGVRAGAETGQRRALILQLRGLLRTQGHYALDSSHGWIARSWNWSGWSHSRSPQRGGDRGQPQQPRQAQQQQLQLDRILVKSTYIYVLKCKLFLFVIKRFLFIHTYMFLAFFLRRLLETLVPITEKLQNL